MSNQRYSTPTRRSILTSVGAVGVGGYGFLRFRGSSTAGSDARYTNYTLAETHGPQLLVGWYSTYNGDLQSGSPIDDDDWDYNSTDEYVDGVDLAENPAVDVGNALPGDSGTLSVGLFIEPESESGRIWMQLEDGGGALSDDIEIDVWYDTGIFGIGGCRGGDNGVSADTITPENATIANPGQLADGIEINPGIFDNGQIDPGDRVCIGLAWSFPPRVSNGLQRESASFELEFVAVDSNDSTNPFAGGS